MIDINFKYTEIDDFKKICDIDVIDEDYLLLEEIAIITIEEYSLAFPNKFEWKELPGINEYIYEYIYKSILFQMKYILENPQFFESHLNLIGSYSVGRISVKQPSNLSAEEIQSSKLSPLSKMYIDRSGIVVKEVCDSNRNNCISCGCGAF